jgi:hypothetical protein
MPLIARTKRRLGLLEILGISVITMIDKPGVPATF